MIRTSTLPRWISGLGVLGSVLVIPLQAQRIPTVRLRPGMVITRSVRIAPGRYRLPGPGGDSALITIRGDGIVVEASGVTLEGSPAGTDPDQRTGLAIWVDGGHGVTLKGARIRGYQTGIRATGTVDLTLLDNDLSDNWRPRLFSLVGHESLIDWLSFHHNENGEWRRFGAGIALEGVHRGLLRGNSVTGGMNGLMLTRSDSLRIGWWNVFRLNSGVGIGLYRSTDNVIISNTVDYNVRGFSPYYRRGQDSADLLMFEQSSRNVVAFNRMTHGGDGLFLWAGQSTMDSGEGGSNDNIFIGNDFSYAPTNGMEATFSRNSFIANRIVGSEHGLWGGYSYGSLVTGNCFAQNRVGIAIEHGQDDTISRNSFADDSTAVQLWADPIEPSDWGYPKHRDTRSRGWQVTGNKFRGNRVGLRVRQTSGFAESNDQFLDVDTLAVMRDTSLVTLDQRPPVGAVAGPCDEMPSIPTDPGVRRLPVDWGAPSAGSTFKRDRGSIVIDEWGPYGWGDPKLWPVDSTRDGVSRLQVLGPSGTWRVAKLRGVASISARSGRNGDTLFVTPHPDSLGDWRIELEDGVGRRFSYWNFEPIRGWDCRYFAWTDSSRWSSTPLLARHEPRLDLMWYRPTIPGLPQAHWALEATTTVDLPRGEYTLRTISDDAIQVWVDGRLLIDHWDPHESLVDNAAIPAGHHELRVRYLQVEGWVELRVEIVRGRVRSQGSPGPH